VHALKNSIGYDNNMDDVVVTVASYCRNGLRRHLSMNLPFFLRELLRARAPSSSPPPCILSSQHSLRSLHTINTEAAARKLFGRSQRASINKPIQGSAADIAMMAMNKINQSAKLQRLGWMLLLQIHDEVILEGPEATAEEAFEAVLVCMQEPWVFGLKETLVPLIVDGSYTHKTWYDAK
jgi:hypothetical protein